MTRLVLDIETIGVDFNSLDELSQESLLKYARNEEEAEVVKDGMGFSPLTGEIVAIGILNPDTEKGAVHFQAPGQDLEIIEEGNIQYVPGTEKEILQKFWDIVQYYDQIITFNGRGFDCPYIMVRSGILKIKPTKNLMPNRYFDQHIDLLDRLTFFGSVQRRMNLHMWCKAFNIPSPKANGVTGDDVRKLFREKKHLDIARYCVDDIVATKELFAYWDKYINIK